MQNILRILIVSTFLICLVAGVTNGEAVLRIGDGRDWQYLGGAWTESGGVIRPPDTSDTHSRAFFTPKAFSDVTVEFEYNANYRNNGSGNAGLVLRARDGGHFYFVHFPWMAQSLRAKNFWGGIAKVSGDGYLRNLVFENVRGVPSETDRWYKVRVEARGPRIRAWIDGCKAFEAIDQDYASGYVGLAGYGWYFFRNVRVCGREVARPKWNKNVQIVKPAFGLPVSSITMPSACIAPNGDVLIGAGNDLLRSKDKGRTWNVESLAEVIPASAYQVKGLANLEKRGKVGDYGNTMFRTSGGRLIIQTWLDRKQAGKPVPEISIIESFDSGKTWSKPAPSKVAEGWPEDPASLQVYGPLVEAADGTLLRFLAGGIDLGNRRYRTVHTWGAEADVRTYCIRSTDGGKSWSAPITTDWPTWTGHKRGDWPGMLDMTEQTGVAIGNTITVLGRPIYSREMWQCWSHDAGKTWDAAVRATFPGYAQSMIRTSSGAIIIGHRHPHYSVNVSRDDGKNWDAGTVIDYSNWAMGAMVEVEPDLVLVLYMNYTRDQPLLGQLIRITPDRIEWIRPE